MRGVEGGRNTGVALGGGRGGREREGARLLGVGEYTSRERSEGW